MALPFSWLDQAQLPEPTPSVDVVTVGSIDDLPATDLASNLVSAIRFTGGAVTLNGMQVGAGVTYGRRIHLMAVGGALTIANAAGTSQVANRIVTGTGASVVIGVGGAAWLVYDQTAQVWRLSGGAGGGSSPSGAAGQLQYYATSTTFGGAGNVTYDGTGLAVSAAGYVALGATPATAGILRATAPGGAISRVLVTKNSAAADVNLISTGPGDLCSWGNTTMDYAVAGVNANLAFSATASISSATALQLTGNTASYLSFGSGAGATGGLRFKYGVANSVWMSTDDNAGGSRPYVAIDASFNFVLGNPVINTVLQGAAITGKVGSTFSFTYNGTDLYLGSDSSLANRAATLTLAAAGGIAWTSGTTTSVFAAGTQVLYSNGTSLYVGTNPAYTVQHSGIGLYAAASVGLGIASSTYLYVNVNSGSVELWKPVAGSATGTTPYRVAVAPSITATAGGVITLTAAQYSCPGLMFIGSIVSGFAAVAPLVNGAEWTVTNGSSQTMAFSGVSGATVSITSGQTRRIFCDGANMRVCT